MSSLDRIQSDMVIDPTSGVKVSQQIGNLSKRLLEFTVWVTDPTYGADSTGIADSTTAITNALATGKNVYFPPGTYLNAGGQTIPDKVEVWGAGMGISIVKHTSNTGNLFSFTLPASESTVSWGGNVIREITLQGTGSTYSGVGLYVKNKVQIVLFHVEIINFQYAVKGARDNAANSVNDFRMNKCRINNNQFGVYAPIGWNACSITETQFNSNTSWSIIAYDSINFTIRDNDFEFGATDANTAHIFMSGCIGIDMDNNYHEGNPTLGAFVKLTQNKDVNGNTANNAINLQTGMGGEIGVNTFTSTTGTPYCYILDTIRYLTFTGNIGGSGIQTALVRNLAGTIRNRYENNYCAGGATIFYDNATTDQPYNYEHTNELVSLRNINSYGGLSFLGGGLSGTSTKPNNFRWLGVAVTANATSVTVTFPTAEPDNIYMVLVSPSWQTTYTITKGASSFIVNFGTAPTTAQTLDWVLIR